MSTPAVPPTLLQAAQLATEKTFATKDGNDKNDHKVEIAGGLPLSDRRPVEAAAAPEGEDIPGGAGSDALPVQNLVAGLYRYYALFIAVPLVLTLISTALRGVAPVCVFDRKSLGAYLQSEQESAPPAGPTRGGATGDVAVNIPDRTAVLDADANHARKIGVPTNPVSGLVAQPGFLAESLGFVLGGFSWMITNLCAGLFVSDPSMETNSLASWTFLSFVLCVLLPYCVFRNSAVIVPLLNHDPELTSAGMLRLSTIPVGAAFVVVWALLTRAYAFRRFPKRRRRVRSPLRIVKATAGACGMLLVTVMVGIQFVSASFALKEVLAAWPAVMRIVVEITFSWTYQGLWFLFAEKMIGTFFLPLIFPQERDLGSSAGGRANSFGGESKYLQLQRQSRVRAVADSEAGAALAVVATTTPEAPSREVPVVEPDFYTDEKNVQLSLRRREDALLFWTHFWCDTLRFVFGRGILLQLSYWSCALLLLNEIFYHAWHFAVRHQEAHLIFQPGRVKGTAPYGFRFHYQASWQRGLFRAFSWLLWLTDGPGIPPVFKRAFVRSYDFLDGGEDAEQGRLKVASKTTSHDVENHDEPCQTVAFQFSNVRLELERVPVAVLRNLFEQSESQRRSQSRATLSRTASHSTDGAVEVARPSNSGGCTRLIPISHSDDQKASDVEVDNDSSPSDECGSVQSEESASSSSSTSNDRTSLPDAIDDCPVPARAGTARRRSSFMGQAAARFSEASAISYHATVRRMSRILPDAPAHERFRGLEDFARFFRKEHFVRYQIRAQARVVVSLVMILVPLVCSASNVSYYASYRGESISIWALVFLGMVFFVKDTVEWYWITWRVMLRNDQCASELLPALFDTICCSKGGLTYEHFRRDGMAQLVAIGSICATWYLCDLLYSRRWMPFELLEIREATGYQNIQWSDIYNFCENA